jgi:hypothetical protein
MAVQIMRTRQKDDTYLLLLPTYRRLYVEFFFF